MPSTSTSGRSTEPRVVSGDLTAFLRSDRGPRVRALMWGDGPNLLAELPDAVIDGPHGIYHMLGGHRLWTAPEVPDRTYRPDDAPCAVVSERGGFRVIAPDDGSGLERELAVFPHPDGFAVEGRIRAAASMDQSVAPWMITQFPIGGVAILPLVPSHDRPEASHALAMWPYTDLADPRLSFGERHVAIHATGGVPLKVGAVPGSGRLGYLRAGWLFVKTASVPDAPTADFGATGQVYDGAGFLELETLGPLVRLEAGAEVAHTEVWSVHRVDDLDAALSIVVGGAR
jgi:hypothetical protein